MRWVFFSSGLLKPPFLFSGFEAEIKFLWDSESKALESLAKPAEFQGIVKRIFLKWDGLWHNVSVFKLLFPKFMISRKMLNMEIINSIFSSPLAAYKVESASQQIYQVLKKIWMRLKIWKTCLVWINQYHYIYSWQMDRARIVKSRTEVWFYGSFYFSFVTWNTLDNFPPADSLNIIQHTSREYGSPSKLEPRHLLGKPMTIDKNQSHIPNLSAYGLDLLSCLILEIFKLFWGKLL